MSKPRVFKGINHTMLGPSESSECGLPTLLVLVALWAWPSSNDVFSTAEAGMLLGSGSSLSFIMEEGIMLLQKSMC